MKLRTVFPLLALALLAAACADCTPLSPLAALDAASFSAGACGLGVSLADAYAEIDALLDEVDALESAGALNAGQARALRNHLNTARRHLDEGRTCPALAQLRAFREQVGNFVRDGVLTAEQAAPLLTGIGRIIDGPTPTRAWLPLGGGFDGLASRVAALSVYHGELIAGGNFLTAGGQTVNYIGSLGLAVATRSAFSRRPALLAARVP